MVASNGDLEDALVKTPLRLAGLKPERFQRVMTGVKLALIKLLYPLPKLRG
jgi:hypothetical protein